MDAPAVSRLLDRQMNRFGVQQQFSTTFVAAENPLCGFRLLSAMRIKLLACKLIELAHWGMPSCWKRHRGGPVGVGSVHGLAGRLNLPVTAMRIESIR